MIEDRTMIRKVWHQCSSDGDAVCSIERVEVQIRWPSGGEPPHKGSACYGATDWTLLPRPLE